jgi:hypothetical protein
MILTQSDVFSVPLFLHTELQTLWDSIVAPVAIAIDSKRQRRWISNATSVVIFGTEKATTVDVPNVGHFLPSPDGQSVIFGCRREICLFQTLTATNIVTIPNAIDALCRTPAGLAAICASTLHGINVRTQQHAAIIQLPPALHAAAIAADHRGNFTFATTTEIWTSRADGSGLIREDVRDR